MQSYTSTTKLRHLDTLLMVQVFWWGPFCLLFVVFFSYNFLPIHQERWHQPDSILDQKQVVQPPKLGWIAHPYHTLGKWAEGKSKG